MRERKDEGPIVVAEAQETGQSGTRLMSRPLLDLIEIHRLCFEAFSRNHKSQISDVF